MFIKPLPHNSPLKLLWNLTVLATILTFVFIMTYRLIFKLFIFDSLYLTLNAILVLDIVVAFFSATKRGHKTYSTYPEIRQYYLGTTFTIDLLSIVPFEALSLLLTNSAIGNPVVATVIIVMQFLTLVKLLKAVKIFAEFKEAMTLSPGLHRLISFAYWFIQALHLMALGWIMIGAAEITRPFFDQYLRAFYWVITTVATIGYGDYYPDHNSNPQIIYTVVIQFFGVGMYSFIIANVSSLVSNIDVARSAYQRKLEEINAFLKNQKIPHDLQDRVRNYYSYLWAEKKSSSTSSVIQDLPPSLSMEILMHQNGDMIRRLEVFQNTEELFIREAIKILQPQIFLPGEFIIRQGEYGDAMYFLTSGQLVVLIGTKEVARLSAGSLFGETALVTDERRNANIKALDYGTGYRLSKNDFVNLRSRYPEFDKRVQKIVASRSVINASESS